MEKVFYDIFDNMPRLAPGSDEATRRSLSYINFPKKNIDVLDIGCGTGASTVVLASELHGVITAVDNHQPYIDQVEEQASKGLFRATVKAECMDMNQIESTGASYDLIWSEGAIYAMGFRKGLQMAMRMLKPRGYVMFSDLNWLKPNPPKDLRAFFAEEYPKMVSAEENVSIIQSEGFRLIGYFMLPYEDHWFPYYAPLERRLELFRKHYADDEDTMKIIDSLQHEADLYKKFHGRYGYVYYIMQRK